jgi:nicotinic acid mononucleotide adenylyltransferase
MRRFTLLSTLASRVPSSSFALVIGMDLVPTLSVWKFSDRLLAECQFIIAPRRGYCDGGSTSTSAGDTNSDTFDLGHIKHYELLHTDGFSVLLSSSEVRAVVDSIRHYHSSTEGSTIMWAMQSALEPLVGTAVSRLISMLDLY